MKVVTTAAAEPRLPTAYRLVALDTVESTNDVAKRLAEGGAAEGMLVWARRQTKGRGRHGRDWASPLGNLYLSLLLRPKCSLAQAAQLGFVAALAIGEAIVSVAPPTLDVTYKWPNDVLVHGRKVSGILLESKSIGAGGLDWLVLGVGMNVQSHPQQTRFPASNLHEEGIERSVDPATLLVAFGCSFLAWQDRWSKEGFSPVRLQWLGHAHGLGDDIEVRLERNTVRGIFRDLDADGALVLEMPDGNRRSIAAGDVVFSI